jgi:hypothetical protein
MLRSEVITGLNALRYILEKNKGAESEKDLKYYDEVLTESIRAVLLNEQNDPHSK